MVYFKKWIYSVCTVRYKQPNNILWKRLEEFVQLHANACDLWGLRLRVII